MQTNIPDLPFTNYGNAELRPSGTRSNAKATPRTYPKTDLETLRPWASFPNDIHQAIQSATARSNLPPTPFTLDVSTRSRFVENEEKLRMHATVALHEPVELVLEKLGVGGWFTLPGGGDTAVVGDPDFSWVTSPAQLYPKVIVEYKTWWVADLVIANLVTAFNGTLHDSPSKQSLDALEQTYGYMTFNNNRFGILSNWKRALFLRRAETPDRKALEYYLVELDGPGQPLSMLKAWVGMMLLAEDNWFYAPPTTSRVPPALNFRTSRAFSNTDEYQCLPIDFHLCRFDLSTAHRGAHACILTARLCVGGHNLVFVCKVVDILRHPDAANMLESEARAYAALQDLQGEVIPTLHGFYQVWGILRFLALEPVGNAISEDELIDDALRMRMRAALQRIHDAGYIHGDIARRNFCKKENDDGIFLVDLESCRRSKSPAELIDEMNEIDQL